MSRWLLALHSSSETLGLAVCDAENPAEGIRTLSRPMGRQLTNGLIPAVEELLPQAEWASIGRLAVSTGPGGFTGTRLTVVMARTLAQQLGCPLHGESSFALMAPRLSVALPSSQALEPFCCVCSPTQQCCVFTDTARNTCIFGRLWSPFAACSHTF